MELDKTATRIAWRIQDAADGVAHNVALQRDLRVLPNSESRIAGAREREAMWRRRFLAAVSDRDDWIDDGGSWKDFEDALEVVRFVRMAAGF